MAVAIDINGNTSYVTYIESQTVMIEETVPSAGDSCSFEFRWPITGALVSKPEVGHIVRITIDGTKEFEGPITSIDEQVGAPRGYIKYLIRCADYTRPFGRELVIGKRPKELASARISWLLTNFCDAAFQSMTFVDQNASTDISVDERTYDHEPITSALDELAESTYHNWYVDFDKNLHFYISEGEASPLNTSYVNVLNVDTNLDVSDVRVTDDISQIRNWIIIKGHKLKAKNALDQQFISDGTQSFFSLYQEPFDFNPDEVKVHVATPAGQSTPGFNSKDTSTPGWTKYTVIEDPLQTREGAITGEPNTSYFCVFNIGCRFGTENIPVVNSLINVRYFPTEGEELSVQVFIDHESIRMMQNREGVWSSGIYQHVENLSHVRVDNENAIVAIGTLLLKRYAWPQITGRFVTYTAGWRSGQFFWLVSGTVDDAKNITTAGERELYDQEAYWKSGQVVKKAIKCFVQGVTKAIVYTENGATTMRTDVTFSNVPFEIKGL